MKSQKCVCESRKCDLCICEKLLISRAGPNVLLNKRDEFVFKFPLKCFKGNPYYSVYVTIRGFLSRYK